ncbi:MAG: N-6 DNA methylase [Limnochordia bacterium]
MAERITIKQAAEQLGVDSSTVRNWIKLGKITKAVHEQRRWLLAADEIASLKNAIESGKLPYLKSRRNKQAAAGNGVPDDYLDDRKLTQAAHTLMQLAGQLTGEGQLLLLLELYLVLLRDQGLIAAGEAGGKPLTGLWLEGDLELGPYSHLVEAFWELCSSSTPEDHRRLEQVRALKLKTGSGQDFLGLVYMSISSLKKRKNAGSYYTPTSIVRKLISTSFHHFNPDSAERIIDPCCGSGNFLIHLFLFLKGRLLAAGWAADEAERKMAETIMGWDNDPVAVLLAKMNLSLLLENPGLIPRLKVFHGDTLQMRSGPRFDLIIGNPPWGYQFSKREARRLAGMYQTAQANGRIESFNVFIEWAVNHVRESGLISYVLPEAFLTAKLHASARQLMFDSCQIEAVGHLGMAFSQVNAPVITLVARKAPTAAARAGHGFYVYGDRTDQDIIDRIKTVPNIVYLKGNADFALGIVTGANRRFLLAEPVPGSEPVITGRDVQPYRIEECAYHLVYRRDLFQQVAPDKYYRAPEKLVYRFIHKNLIVAYDDQGRLSINSANIIIPRIEGVSIKYILAVLNSRIAQYYRMVTNPSVKVLRGFLETIPIVACAPAEENTIVDLTNRIIRSKSAVERRKLFEEIDQNLMNYYNLPAKHQTYIRRKCQTVELL